MKKVRKAFKVMKKDLKKAFKSKKEVVVKFKADTRFEFIVRREKVNDKTNIHVELRKDCASVTKNGDYHMLYSNTYGKHDKDAYKWVMDATYGIIIMHKCRCKKDQEKKARSMICTAKRINGRWVY